MSDFNVPYLISSDQLYQVAFCLYIYSNPKYTINLPLETDINMNKARFNRATSPGNTDFFPNHYMLIIPHKQDQRNESK